MIVFTFCVISIIDIKMEDTASVVKLGMPRELLVNVKYYCNAIKFFKGLLTLAIMPDIIQCIYTYCIR